jgi:hypothetical protein
MDEQKFQGGTKIRINEASRFVGTIKVDLFQMVRQKEASLVVNELASSTARKGPLDSTIFFHNWSSKKCIMPAFDRLYLFGI